MNLILFTSTYPFDSGGEQAFLDVEIQHLCRVFKRVILVPKKCDGQYLPIPHGAEVDESYAKLLRKVNFLSLIGRILGSGLIYRELFSRPSLLFYPNALVRLVRSLAVAKMTQDWVEAWLDQNDDKTRNVFYTYWFDNSSMGIGLAKQLYPDIKLISRVHGYDLYEEYYYKPAYLPFRRVALALLDKLFPDAHAALTYLFQKYPEYSFLYEEALLGVPNPNITTLPSTDGVFRIVSCSYLVPVKRVELLIEGLLFAARLRPEQQFEWTHIGDGSADGSARRSFQEDADTRLPSNVKALFPGFSNRNGLMNFYEDHPVDVFVNVSASEGRAVAIQEAISCGIPVIATSVGGSPEIVTEKNGILISPDPTPEEIANALFVFLDNPKMAAQKRRGSHEIWAERCNADVHYRLFAERLKSIGDNG